MAEEASSMGLALRRLWLFALLGCFACASNAHPATDYGARPVPVAEVPPAAPSLLAQGPESSEDDPAVSAEGTWEFDAVRYKQTLKAEYDKLPPDQARMLNAFLEGVEDMRGTIMLHRDGTAEFVDYPFDETTGRRVEKRDFGTWRQEGRAVFFMKEEEGETRACELAEGLLTCPDGPHDPDLVFRPAETQ